MAAAALSRNLDLRGAARAPTPLLLWAAALAGLAAAGASFALALTSDHVPEPGLQAALLDWITLPYILGGLIAWWRRPDCRFGPLMVAAGFAMFVSSFQWAIAALPYTIGLAFDLLPPGRVPNRAAQRPARALRGRRPGGRAGRRSGADRPPRRPLPSPR